MSTKEHRSPESLAKRKIYKHEKIREKRINPEFKAKEKRQRVIKMATEEEKERRASYRKKYRSSKKGKDAEKKYKQSERGKRGYLKSHLKRRYGLEIADVELMLENQSNRCLLCGDNFTESRFHVVDHDHITGRVRGLIHQRCNAIIGLANDDLNFLKMAVNYLRDY